MSKIKSGDAVAFRRLFNFLIKCQTMRIRRSETREPELLDLTNFIEDEMILVNDPLFSREAVVSMMKRPQDLRSLRSTRRFTHMLSQRMLWMKGKLLKLKQGIVQCVKKAIMT